jgi:hypothetical protein
MSTIFVRRPVADYDVWRPGFDSHQKTRQEYGLVDVRVYRSVDDPNDVTIVLTTDDVARAQEFIASDDLRETMGRLGVTAAPDIWFTDEA